MAKVIIMAQREVPLPAKGDSPATTLYQIDVLKPTKYGNKVFEFWLKEPVDKQLVTDPITAPNYALCEADFDVDENKDGTLKMKIANIRPEQA
jgi:hypothetical protein